MALYSNTTHILKDSLSSVICDKRPNIDKFVFETNSACKRKQGSSNLSLETV